MLTHKSCAIKKYEKCLDEAIDFCENLDLKETINEGSNDNNDSTNNERGSNNNDSANNEEGSNSNNDNTNNEEGIKSDEGANSGNINEEEYLDENKDYITDKIHNFLTEFFNTDHSKQE
ncbi:13485_t:CDS:2 [Racocetra fulgida]|uniref:13485_t:CDS:1 n=1 Tax=Racocetra fulgida TaxID=60492 RepID=A0A9N9GIN7_9GLOM|nr:13485_t:CDS:2 [Racocetra fulgida]